MRFTQIDVFSLYTDIDDTFVWSDTHKYLFLTLFWFLFFLYELLVLHEFSYFYLLYCCCQYTTQISFIVPFLKNARVSRFLLTQQVSFWFFLWFYFSLLLSSLLSLILLFHLFHSLLLCCFIFSIYVSSSSS